METPETAVGRSVALEQHGQRVTSREDGRLVIQFPFSDTEESTDDLGSTTAAVTQEGREVDSPPRLRPVDDAEDSEGVPDSQLDEAEKAMKNEQVTMSGYLYKKGEKRRNWKNRWFVLRPTRLAYYQSDKEYELLKIIDMNDIHAIAEVELKRRKNVFGLVTRERTYYIQAENAKTADSWLRALRAAHHHIHGGGNGNRSSETASAPPVQPQANGRDTSSQMSNAESVGTADSFQTNTTTPSSMFTDYAHSADSSPSTVIPYMPPPAPVPNINNTIAAPVRDVPPQQRRDVVGIRITTFADRRDPSSTSPVGEYPTSSTTSTPQHGRPETSSSDEEGEDMDACMGGGNINDNKVVVQGYLEKRVTNNYKKLATAKGWKKRWFVLRNGRLFGYKNDGEYVVKRLIPLRSVLDILEIDPQGKTHQFCFKIVLPKRQLVLCARTEEEMKGWIEGLRNVHGAVRRDSTAGVSQG
ncbi:hypothetical protein PhCBS80983_g05567 [Powellomyces hirtus]|uniref:PH domain-containing protein n=1 Tax=Powellomyces hirtus TaxID=109895 RepID=A0A507DVB0_9FUNG|nr:hypothetical protein PhCBS80983_g05567 [Powellomyces hirtus]